jgi:cytochrome oxidase assembly protein ShyY1
MSGLIERRRSVSGFAIFTLVMVAIFSGLGIWQLQRRVEKHALIAMLNERLAAPPGRCRSPRNGMR